MEKISYLMKKELVLIIFLGILLPVNFVFAESIPASYQVFSWNNFCYSPNKNASYVIIAKDFAGATQFDLSKVQRGYYQAEVCYASMMKSYSSLAVSLYKENSLSCPLPLLQKRTSSEIIISKSIKPDYSAYECFNVKNYLDSLMSSGNKKLIVSLYSSSANIAYFWGVKTNYPPVLRLSYPEFKESKNAIQTIYQNGVPHADKTGNLLFDYKESQSFFPIWSYGIGYPTTAYIGHPDKEKIWNKNNSLSVSNSDLLKQANFNTLQTWWSYNTNADYFSDVVSEAKENNLQIIGYSGLLNKNLDEYPETKKIISNYSNDSNILGWIVTEEVGRYLSGLYEPKDRTMDEWLAHFINLSGDIKKISPRPVFILDNLWVANLTELGSNDSWANLWKKFNAQFDIIANDNYPQNLNTLSTFDLSNGITRGAKYSVETVNAKKPFWVLLPAFEGQKWTFPTPDQEKAMVYASIIHGATGIGYFGFDSYILREGQVIGVRPDTPIEYTDVGYNPPNGFLKATEEQKQKSILLWQKISGINSELQQLTPMILSKTAADNYSVWIAGSPVSETPIRTLLKKYNNSYYLFAVNLDNTQITAQFKFNQVNPNAINVLFENRTIAGANLTGGFSFNDVFSPFAVHIYQWGFK